MNKLVTDIKDFTSRVKVFHKENFYYGHKQETFGHFREVLETRGEQGLVQTYLNKEQLPLFFTDSELVKDINENNNLEYSSTLDNDKTTILELSIHPILTEDLNQALEGFFRNFDKDLITLMQNNKVLCLIWFGWEADDWTMQGEFLKTSHYDVIIDFQQKYNIPPHSMVFLHSNLRGEELEKRYYKDRTDIPHVWYDYWYEFESFVRRKNSSPLEYSFEDYFHRLKKEMKYKFLRVNRTWNRQRDYLAYSIEKMGYFNECNWEMQRMDRNSLREDIQVGYEEAHGIKELESLLPMYETIDEDAINKIEERLPLIASAEERRLFKLNSDHHSNETVPSSIYTTAPISYISTSFPDRDNQVFLHMSTFNPILNYHPILFNGNPYTIREMNRIGFKTYNYLFNETYDYVWSERERLMYSLLEFEKIVKLSNNEILDLIYDNQDKLIFNRELVISLQSYHRFFDRLNRHLNTYYDNK